MTTKNRKERERLLRIKQITSSAKKLFYEYGFDKTTVEEIAKESELAKGTLYLYFKSKEEIFAQIILEILREMYQRMTQGAETGKRGIDHFQSIGKAYTEMFIDRQNDFKMLTEYARLGAERNILNQELLDSINEVNMGIFALVNASIQEGLDDNSITNKVNPHLTSLIIPAMTQSVLSLIEQGKEDLKNNFNVSPIELLNYYFSLLTLALTNHEQD